MADFLGGPLARTSAYSLCEIEEPCCSAASPASCAPPLTACPACLPSPATRRRGGGRQQAARGLGGAGRRPGSGQHHAGEGGSTIPLLHWYPLLDLGMEAKARMGSSMKRGWLGSSHGLFYACCQLGTAPTNPCPRPGCPSHSCLAPSTHQGAHSLLIYFFPAGGAASEVHQARTGAAPRGAGEGPGKLPALLWLARVASHAGGSPARRRRVLQEARWRGVGTASCSASLRPPQAECDAAKAQWEEEKKLGRATPSKDAAKERRLSDIASERSCFWDAPWAAWLGAGGPGGSWGCLWWLCRPQRARRQTLRPGCSALACTILLAPPNPLSSVHAWRP